LSLQDKLIVLQVQSSNSAASAEVKREDGHYIHLKVGTPPEPGCHSRGGKGHSSLHALGW
jgi:hypothetical protein